MYNNTIFRHVALCKQFVTSRKHFDVIPINVVYRDNNQMKAFFLFHCECLSSHGGIKKIIYELPW